MFCSLCGDHARHPKSPEVDLRRKDCPRFPEGVIRSDSEGQAVTFGHGVVHRGCCAKEVCSDIDTRGHVRCGWECGGKERYLVELIDRERDALEKRAPVHV